LGSPAGAGEALGRLEDKARRILFNPLTRLLSCRDWEERLHEFAVSDAIEALSEFDAVGVRGDLRGFLYTLEALFRRAERIGDLRLEVYPSVLGLARMLRETPVASEFVALDLEVFTAVLDAVKKVEEGRVGVGENSKRAS
jgi:hypothetical protein